MLITVDYGGGGNCQNIDYVICERPLITNSNVCIDGSPLECSQKMEKSNKWNGKWSRKVKKM